MNFHFIAIGGSAMHNLALALAHQGHHVTGSDDEIFEPSRSRLDAAGILPEKMGWYEERLSSNIDAVILGMHAREDNPELARARALNIPIYSYPEFLYERTKDKQRIVIGGSHGKTTITSMVLHALHYNKLDPDYMVGALLEGFDRSVRLSDEADIAVFEGDEYLSSPIDRRPKFHLYHANIALISGIAWDHMNVFPTFDEYLDQFRIFVHKIEAGGTLVYNEEDDHVRAIAEAAAPGITLKPYSTPSYEINEGETTLLIDGKRIPVKVFGRHNLQNMEGARMVCEAAGLTSEAFYSAMQHFRGASRRLEKLHETEDFVIYRDFAHAPSKLRATTSAVKEMYPDRTLVACMELHTFSSLSRNFLSHYEGSMNDADIACVYFSPEVVAHKRLPEITSADVTSAFGKAALQVFTDPHELKEFVNAQSQHKAVLLLMSSGNWGGVDLLASST